MYFFGTLCVYVINFRVLESLINTKGDMDFETIGPTLEKILFGVTNTYTI